MADTHKISKRRTVWPFDIFDSFIESPQIFIDQYNADRAQKFETYGGINHDDPFIVSYILRSEIEMDEDVGVSPEQLQSFYISRLVEYYVSNELRGYELWEKAAADFDSEFPEADVTLERPADESQRQQQTDHSSSEDDLLQKRPRRVTHLEDPQPSSDGSQRKKRFQSSQHETLNPVVSGNTITAPRAAIITRRQAPKADSVSTTTRQAPKTDSLNATTRKAPNSVSTTTRPAPYAVPKTVSTRQAPKAVDPRKTSPEGSPENCQHTTNSEQGENRISVVEATLSAAEDFCEYVGAGLARGFIIPAFVLDAALKVSYWVWTSPTFGIPRWMVGNLFWGSLVIVILCFLVAVIWEKIQELLWKVVLWRIRNITEWAPFQKIPLVGSILEPLIFGAQDDSRQFIDSGDLVVAVQNFTTNSNISDHIPILVENLLQVCNLTAGGSLVVGKVLALTEGDLLSSRSIIRASSIPFREEISEGYKILRAQIPELVDSLRSFGRDTIWGRRKIKQSIRYTFDRLDKFSVSPYMAEPPPLSSLVRATQSAFYQIKSACEFIMLISLPDSLVFCGTTTLLSDFLESEILCHKFEGDSIAQPDTCLNVLGPPPRLGLQQQRESAFNAVAGLIESLLTDMTHCLRFLERSVQKPRDQLLKSWHVREDLDEKLKESAKIISDEEMAFQMRRDQVLNRWNSRSFYRVAADWFAGGTLEEIDIPKAVKIKGQSQDLATLENIQQRISQGLGSVDGSIAESWNDIQVVKTFIANLRNDFSNKFCVFIALDKSVRDCGTDHDFVEAINGLVLQIYELMPLLDRIEKAGIMSTEADRDVAVMEKGLETECNAAVDKERQGLDQLVPPLNPFALRFRVEHVKTKCMIDGWLRSL